MLRSLAARSGATLRAARPGPIARRPLTAVRQVHGSAPAQASKEEEKLPQSYMEKFQLDEPSRFVPLTLGTFGLLTATGIYHIDGESQLMVLWALFCGTVYSRVGPMISSALEESRQEILKEQRAVEEEQIAALKLAIEAGKSTTTLYEDVKALADTQNAVLANVVASGPNRARHAARAKIVRQLDILVQQERKLVQMKKDELIGGATAHVNKAYSGKGADKLKASALDAALAVLANPSKAKKDPTVGDLYKGFFAQYRKEQEAKKGSTVTLPAERVKEIQDEVDAHMRREGFECDFKVDNKLQL